MSNKISEEKFNYVNNSKSGSITTTIGEGRISNKVSTKEKFSYAIGSGGGNIITTVIGMFLTSYYTDSVGLAAAAVGTMMLLARLLDGVVDIFMGGIIDKTKTRWGKSRPWILISAPIICVGLILTFSVPSSFSDSGKLIYAYLTYIFINCIGMTIFMLSHTSLMARMTYDSHERQVMSSMNQIVNNVMSLIVSSIAVPMVSILGWKITAVIYGIITAVMVMVAFWGTREHIDMNEGSEQVTVENVSLKEAIPALLKNRYFYLLAIIFMILLIISTGPGSVMIYYCNVTLENPNMMTPLSIASTLPMIIVNIFVPTIIRKIGRYKCMIINTLLVLVGFVIIAIGESNVYYAIAGNIIKAFGMGTLFGCAFALSAEVVDYGDWKYKVRSEGIINSCISFGQKVGLGLGAAGASWILAAGGYVGTVAVQTQSAKSAIIFAFGYFGVILAIVLLIACIFMNVDKYSEEMKKELEERRAK